MKNGKMWFDALVLEQDGATKVNKEGDERMQFNRRTRIPELLNLLAQAHVFISCWKIGEVRSGGWRTEDGGLENKKPPLETCSYLLIIRIRYTLTVTCST